jgi:hypothetical protein
MNGNTPTRSAPLSYIVAIVGTLLIFYVLVSAMKRYTAPEPLGQARVEERLKFLAELRGIEAQTLDHYDWQDKTKGLVRLKVDRAMELTIQEYKDPAAARAAIVAKAEQAFTPPPEKPSEFE